MNYAEHIESHLGELDQGWKAEGSDHRAWVVRFSRRPWDTATTYSTVGLSNHVLELPDRRIRQEIICCLDAEGYEDDAVNLLVGLSGLMLGKHWALDQGDVIGPYEPIFAGTQLTAAYATTPFVFAQEMWVLRDTEPITGIVMILPITSDEAAFVKERGWSSFDRLLETTETNLWNPRRDSIVH